MSDHHCKQNTAIIPRLYSLDIFRGLTIVMMILVNSPGYEVTYRWLAHSRWNGCTLADIIFPVFIVIMGIATVLSLTQLNSRGFSQQQLYGVIFKRTAYLFLLGLLLNVFPHHTALDSLRICGVLQRIAICYCASACLFLTTGQRTQLMIIVLILLAYWLLFYLDGYPASASSKQNIVQYIDILVLTPAHMYQNTLEPEGLLSTLPAIATALLGNHLGYILRIPGDKTHLAQQITRNGVCLCILGWLWHFFLPLNKSLWTSSYVLWTGGLAYLIYACLYTLIEIKHITVGSKFLFLFGRNALLVYILHVLGLKLQASITVTMANGCLSKLRYVITHCLFGELSDVHASLSYACLYVVCCWLIMYVLHIWRVYWQNIRHNP